ncbi:MAG: hypothetical protein IKA64_04825 [Clostridia bacterium]|nr:hypothetical protein [Clostridia bacterium]
MTVQEREKLRHVEKTFELNFKLTHLYKAYLELFPELINAEMINILTEGGDTPPERAFAAILCEAFGLDVSGTPDERRLIRDYVYPSVRLLDPKRYTENPYYKKIKIPDIKDGDWEFKTECYPAYRGVVCDDMIISDDLTEIVPLGFFREDFYFPAVLECGNEWMTLTPVDLDTSDEAIERARGRVVTFGLGLGYFAFMASEKSEVESVTVVEKSPEVIRLFKKHILPQFPNGDKITVIEADAFEYAERVMPREHFDFAFVDTWRDASDGAVAYKRMKPLERLSPSTEFSYWIERFLISAARAEKYCELIERVREGDASAPKTAEEFIAEIKK